MSGPLRLTKKTLAEGLDGLASRDPDLAGVVQAFGSPPIWARPPGFETLVHIILEQQVSLASARAAFDRLVTEVVELTPDSFLKLHHATLKRIGFSRQKRRYCRGLATAVRDRTLDLDRLENLEDQEARAELIQIKGIGSWTADIYLLIALGRPDIWPIGDLALAKAAQRVKQLDSVPTPEELEEIGEAWRPWRAVAARLLWHHYLSSLGTRESDT